MQPNRLDEILRGLTIFAAMSYIVLLNPIVLAPLGLPLGWVLVATCLVAGIGSVLIGIRARAPSAMAPGMGLNNFMASFGTAWAVAAPVLLVMNFVAGLFVRHLSRPKWVELNGETQCLSTRLKWLKSLPRSLQDIIDASIAGLLLSVAGTFIAGDQAAMLGLDASESPITILSRLDLWDGRGRMTPLLAVAITVGAIFLSRLVCDVLLERLEPEDDDGKAEAGSSARARAAVAVRIAKSLTLLASVLLAWLLIEGSRYEVPAGGGLGRAPFLDPGWWRAGFAATAPDTLLYIAIYFFTVLFVLLFDVTGTPFVMLPHDAEKRDERISRGFRVESGANIAAPLVGISPISCYIENKVGQEVGESPLGGQSAIVVGALFLLVGGAALARLDLVVAMMSSIPRSALAPMLIWVMFSIAGSELKRVRTRPDVEGEGPSGARKRRDLQHYEGIIAAGVTLLGAVQFGLAFGLSLGIVLIFLLGLLTSREKEPEEYILFIFALLAIVGQGATMLKIAAGS